MTEDFIKPSNIDVKKIVHDINSRKAELTTENLEEEDYIISKSSQDNEINCLNPDITGLVHLPTSTRGGVVSKINSKIIKKIYFITRHILDRLINHQNHINYVLTQKVKDLDQKFGGGEIDFNYLEFENIHRGSLEDITKKQSTYLHYFSENSTVVDIGCGRGEFLDALKAKNINAIGVDTNPQMVEFCTQRGHLVYQEGLITFLSELKKKVNGIFSAQVVEHLEYKEIIEFVRLAFNNLEKDGNLIMETLNVQVLIPHLGAYYTDPTHKNFIHPETLKFICYQAGFSHVEVVYSNPVDKNEALQKEGSMSEIQKTNIDKLNGLIYGPRDFAIVARK